MLEMLEQLCAIPGVSGREDAVRRYILSQIRELADEITVDPCGSLIALKKGARAPERRLMLTAHMDEPGLIVTGIDDGLLRIDTVGGIDPRVLCGRTVLVGEQKLPGVIGIPPIHLTAGDDRDKCPKPEAMTVDIGAKDADEARTYVSPGDVCVFDTVFERMGDGLLKGRAVGGRAGCAVLIELMRREYMCDVYFVFSALDEVGWRGAGCAAYTVEPDAAIVIDTAEAGDLPGIPDEKKGCRLGAGAAVAFMDRKTIYDRSLFDLALDLGRMSGISTQVRQTVDGGSGAATIHRSRGGVRTLSVGIPCRYVGAPASLVSENDMNAVLELTGSLADALLI